MQSTLIILFLTLYLLLPAARGQSASEIAIRKGVVYSTAGGQELKLDIGQPEGPGPFPVVLFFHGGGWQQGHRSHMHKWIRKFASSGYVGVSVSYRFAPAFKWPSQVADAKEAVRYVRAHAAELNIDPDNIGVMGESAGGYLALMVGVTSPEDGLEGESALPEFSSRVQAVVSYFSATDFTASRHKLTPELERAMLEYYHKSLQEVRTDFTGTSDPRDPILKKISVLTYVDEKDPPVLMFHGDADPFVSIEHPTKLRNALEQAAVPHELVIVKGGGHGWTGPMQDETTLKMMGFFERTLVKGRR